MVPTCQLVVGHPQVGFYPTFSAQPSSIAGKFFSSRIGKRRRLLESTFQPAELQKKTCHWTLYLTSGLYPHLVEGYG